MDAVAPRLKSLRFSDLNLLIPATPRICVDEVLLELPQEYREEADLLRAKALENQNADFAIEYDGVRYRGQILDHLYGRGVVLRRVIKEVVPWNRLGLPTLALPALLGNPTGNTEPKHGIKSGLIIVAGWTGAGKSTTCTSLVTEFLARNAWQCTTVEDPIEIILPSAYKSGAQCVQIEVRGDSRDFSRHLYLVLRTHSKLVMVGEIRDMDAAKTALDGARAGHLVICTTHAADISAALERFIGIGDMEGIDFRGQLAEAFRACIYQQLTAREGVQGSFLRADFLFQCASVRSKIAAGKFSSLKSEADQQTQRLKRNQPPLDINERVD